MPTKARVILILVTLCPRDHVSTSPSLSWSRWTMKGGMSEKWEPQRASSSPACRHLFFGAGKDLRNHIRQGSGRKQMALSNWVIWGEFNKGAIYKGWAGTRGTTVQCSGTSNSATVTALGPKGWGRRGYWNLETECPVRGLPARSPDKRRSQENQYFGPTPPPLPTPQSYWFSLQGKECNRGPGSKGAHSYSPYWSDSRAQGRVEKAGGKIWRGKKRTPSIRTNWPNPLTWKVL